MAGSVGGDTSFGCTLYQDLAFVWNLVLSFPTSDKWKDEFLYAALVVILTLYENSAF